MPSLDIFNDDAFSMSSLTARVNKGTYRPGQVSAAGVFEEDGVTTTSIIVEERDGKLSLVEPTPRGGPGETKDSEKRATRSFAIPHYERNDTVMADEVQNVRAFGSETELETIMARVDRKAARHAADLTMTLEHQRVTALKGILVTKGGSTLANLFTEFGVSAAAATSLELDVDATKVGKLVKDVVYGVEDALDEPYSGIHAFCGRDFHNYMWNHPNVRETFLGTVQAPILRAEVPDIFQFGNITWERYRTGAKATTDLGAPYIGLTDAYLCVKGVPDLYITRFAPADYEDTVNTVGLPFYAQQYAMPNNKGRHLDVQSNFISLCTRPGVLKRLTLT